MNGPSPHDTRPLRITIFPEFPQALLIYVPEGQVLWLPSIPTPFDLDQLCDALDAHDVPHDTREGDRNRWWKNMRQSADMDAGMKGQRAREALAVSRVKIHLSAEAATLAQQRAELILMRDKVQGEINQLKAQIGLAKGNAAARGKFEKPGVFRGWEQKVAALQDSYLAINRQLGELKGQIRDANIHATESAKAGRERRFIEKAKRFLNREQVLSIWAEIEQEDQGPRP